MMSRTDTKEWADDDIAALNSVAAFLACNDVLPGGTKNADVIVLAGNSILTTAEGAFGLAKEINRPLLITGGIGHATSYLMTAIAAHPVYRAIAGKDRTEADALRRIAQEFWHVPGDRILEENASTNCGENAAYATRLMAASGLTPQKIVLIQDPLMQRRSDASFRHAWGKACPQICNWPVFVPYLTRTGKTVGYAQAITGPWPLDRFVSLILGEIPRLRDDEYGYGPKGRGFIVHVDIPDAVEAAHAHLLSRFGDTTLSDRTRPPR